MLTLRLTRLATPRVVPRAVGHRWELDRWGRFDRFLIFGTERGTYYVRARRDTAEQTADVRACIALDGPRAVRRIVEISTIDCAPSNEPALVALALAATLGNAATRSMALEALPEVARTRAHLSFYLRHLRALRGMGRAVRRAVVAWHATRPGTALGSQRREASEALAHLRPSEAATVIVRHDLTPSMLPPHLLRHAVVWEALLRRMPTTTILHSLGAMTEVGLISATNDAAWWVADRLRDREALRAAGLHPVALLAALRGYAQGSAQDMRWHPVPLIIDALDDAFHASLRLVPPTGARLLVALDIAEAMATPVAGLEPLRCDEVAATMALSVAASEPRHRIVAFTGDATLTSLALSRRCRLGDVMRATSDLSTSPVDPALPMVEAARHRWPVDAFVVYTTDPVHAGPVTAVTALHRYRERMGIPAKLIVLGAASHGFAVADPDDAGMMDVAGFDYDVPAVVREVVRM
jgi:60 kDa SS-A/Ro ribonucleoprotein